MQVDRRLVTELRSILTGIAASGWMPKKRELQRATRATRKLIAPGWLVALDRAVKGGKQRKRAAVLLLGSLADVPEARDRISAWLHDADCEWRAEVINLVGNQGLTVFAADLNASLDPSGDELCRAYAISAVGLLRSEANVDAFARLLKGRDKRLFRRLLWAAKDFPHERFRLPLKSYFRTGTKEQRVIAAWALGKLGDDKAIEYLGKMLDDPDETTPNSFLPGESLRAAQGLCDIFKWPFRWDANWVPRVRKWWNERSR
jgi:hypothetical protein